MKHDPSSFASAAPATSHLDTADFVGLLHPPTARGKSTIMLIDGAGGAKSRTYELPRLPFAAEVASEGAAYITLNRFYGPRRTDHLAELNAIFLDLDFHKLGRWKPEDWPLCALQFQADLEARRIRQPSFLMHSGRGLYAIWLIEALPPQALPRWTAAVRALVELYGSFGADRACSDAARVFRVPGTLNAKSGATVKVIGGTQQRHDFDDLADQIYRASGRPTRAALKKRKARKAAKDAGEASPRGLPPAARFRAIERDLDRLRVAWGGTVPQGLRNNWLHLKATCLTHYAAARELPEKVRAHAAQATPELPEREVEYLIRSVTRRAEMASSSDPATDGRLHYSGATIAQILGVSDDLARALELEQVYSQHERRRREAERERERRAAKGAATRAEYLAENSASREKPWTGQGVSRATYYRRRGAASADAGGSTGETDETGACPLQGGSATPEATARIPGIRAFGTYPPPGRTRPANLEIGRGALPGPEQASTKPGPGGQPRRCVPAEAFWVELRSLPILITTGLTHACRTEALPRVFSSRMLAPGRGLDPLQGSGSFRPSKASQVTPGSDCPGIPSTRPRLVPVLRVPWADPAACSRRHRRGKGATGPALVLEGVLHAVGDELIRKQLDRNRDVGAKIGTDDADLEPDPVGDMDRGEPND